MKQREENGLSRHFAILPLRYSFYNFIACFQSFNHGISQNTKLRSRLHFDFVPALARECRL